MRRLGIIPPLYMVFDGEEPWSATEPQRWRQCCHQRYIDWRSCVSRLLHRPALVSKIQCSPFGICLGAPHGIASVGCRTDTGLWVGMVFQKTPGFKYQWVLYSVGNLVILNSIAFRARACELHDFTPTLYSYSTPGCWHVSAAAILVTASMLTMLLKLIKPCFHAAMLLTLLWLLLQLTLLLQPVTDPAATACCCSLSLDQTVEIHLVSYRGVSFTAFPVFAQSLEKLHVVALVVLKRSFKRVGERERGREGERARGRGWGLSQI